MGRGDRTVARGNDRGRWGITYDLHAEINRAREPGDDRVERMARRGTWLFPCTSGRSRRDDIRAYVQSATVRSVKGLQVSFSRHFHSFSIILRPPVVAYRRKHHRALVVPFLVRLLARVLRVVSKFRIQLIRRYFGSYLCVLSLTLTFETLSNLCRGLFRHVVTYSFVIRIRKYSVVYSFVTNAGNDTVVYSFVIHTWNYINS